MIKELFVWRFKGERAIHRYHKELPNCIYKWKEFLERREFIVKYGVGMFIIKYLTNKNTGKNYFIERFYPNVLKKNTNNLHLLNQKEIEQLAMRLEKEIKKLFNKWVDRYPNFKPYLPEYAKHLIPTIQMRIYKFL